MPRETAGQIDAGKQGKRIGKINRDGIEKREKRQRGKGKIEKGELSRKKRGKAQGNRPMTTNEGEKGKHGRRKKKRGRRRQEKINKTGRGNRLQSEEGKSGKLRKRAQIRKYKNDTGRFGEARQKRKGKAGEGQTDARKGEA